MVQRIDPHEVPVIGIDDHLLAVPAGRLTAAALRARFAAPPQWQPEYSAERLTSSRDPVSASVLIAVVLRSEPTIVLTRRAAGLTDHPGQVSFPGGRAETHDTDAVATALREAEEEIGLPPSRVDVLGVLPLYATTSGFHVTPVVGLIDPEFPVVADPSEVAEVFEVPLRFLMDPANHRRHALRFGDGRREFLSMPWDGSNAQGQPQRYMVWGATAAMLRNFYRFLSA